MIRLLFALFLCAISLHGATYNPPSVVDSISTLTNATPLTTSPNVIVQGTASSPSLLYQYSSTATNAVSSPTVLPAKGGGRWIAYSSSSTTWAAITGKPTTLSGFGITDAQALNTNLTQFGTAVGSVGEIWYRASNGVVTNLALGTTGQVLIVTNGVPKWMAITDYQPANTNLLQLSLAVGSVGEIWYRASNGVITNLGIGSTGQTLIVTNGAPKWMTPASGGGGSTITIDGSGSLTNLAGSSGISNVVSGGTSTLTLRNSGVTSGTYTDHSVTFDATGRATAATSVPDRAIWATNSFTMHDELLGGSATTGDAGTSGAANGGSVGYASSTWGHMGQRFLQITANSTNSPNWGWLRTDTMALTNSSSSEEHIYRTQIQTPATLSGASGTNVYQFTAGFGDITSAQTNLPANGAYLTYCTNLIGSGAVNWALVTVLTSTASAPTDTGVPVTASTYYALEVKLTPTNAVATINGVPVATNSTRIPNSKTFLASNRLIALSGITGNTTVNMDYLFYKWTGYR